MSLISLLLALSPPLAARFKKPDETDRLRAELAKAKEEITGLRRERDMWRDRAYQAVPARIMQNVQHQQSNLAQHVLLGAQNLSVLDEMFCNCVPARHDLLIRG